MNLPIEMKRVLIFDDDESILEIMEYLLNEQGIDVLTQQESLNAEEAIKTFQPDLIIVDLKMPGRSGIQVLQLLRSLKLYTETPVLLCSCCNDLPDIASALHVAGWISKPFNIDAFCNKVDSVLNQHLV